MSKAAYARGMKTRRKVLGDAWVDQAERGKTAFNEEFQALITRYAWDEIWNRPRFTHKTRRLLVLAMLAALGHWEEFRLHVRSALESGDLEADDVKEVLLQAAIYCGVPTANHAFREAKGEVERIAAQRAPKAKRGR
jgi:4-carboxymuconolactone decarboxylase